MKAFIMNGWFSLKHPACADRERRALADASGRARDRRESQPEARPLRPPPSIGRLAFIVAFPVFLAVSFAAHAQQQFVGWCAQARVEIDQELTLERIGFEATLQVSNNMGEDAITGFYAELTFEDAEDGADASDLFFVRAPELSFVNRVDGDGVIQPARTAVIRWFIIPKIDAGGTTPDGRQYRVGCDLGGKLGGVEIPKEYMFAMPDTITVKPEAQLDITYFLPRDVQANDPFTDRVESPVPFTLGVLVRNVGYGTALDLQIDSQQPVIVENKQGLPLVAQLLGARVMDAELDRASLLVDLGDIPPGQARKGAWDMITSLSGEFVEFKADYTHASELGGEETSVIVSLEAHFLHREVLNDQPGRDDVRDFLAITKKNQEEENGGEENPGERIPDVMYESEGNVVPVNHLTQAVVVQGLDQDHTAVVGVQADFDEWGYLRVDDPGQDRYAIEKVVRSDGKVLNPHNAWTTYRYERPSNRRLEFLHIFDFVESGRNYEYTVHYAVPVEDTDPPETEIHFSGDHTIADDGVVYVTRYTDVFFIAEDDSPVSMYYRIDDGEFQPAIPFRLRDPGVFVIEFFSEDLFGNVEAVNAATVVLPATAPGFAEFETGPLTVTLSGDSLSVRPDRARIAFEAEDSPVPLHATAEVFAGIVSWPVLAGVPPTPTPDDGAEILVGGDHVDYYRYRLDAGEWSEEVPASEPLLLEGLSGEVTLAVLARHGGGYYRDAGEALTVFWTVDPGAPAFELSGLPATPSREENPALAVVGPGEIEKYRWTINEGYFRPELSPGETFEPGPLDPGVQSLDLVAQRGGQWEPVDDPVRHTWTYDSLYGSDLSALPLVRAEDLGDVGGRTVGFEWDGRNDGGVLLPAGWYTVKVTLSDGLGHERFATRLVRVGNLTAEAATLAAAGEAGRRPHARGDWAVWQARPEGVWEVFARNLAEGAAAVERLGTGEHPHTDGRWAVWQKRRSDGGWDVWMRDLAEGGEPERLTDDSTLRQTRPVVHYPWVVWQSRVAGDSSAPEILVARDLESGETFEIDPGPADQIEADIHGGRVVWRDQRDVGVGEIYFADLVTGQRRRITEIIDGQFHPAIYGHWIVWQDTRDGVVQISGYDLLREKEVRLTDGAHNQTRPYLQGYWMIVEEDSAGPETGNFVLHHLEAGNSVPLTNSLSAKSNPGLAGGRLVWEEQAGASTAVHKADLPALQPVFRNRNAVVVTASLAERFDTAFALLANWREEAGVGMVKRYHSLAPELVVETAEWDVPGEAPAGENFPLNPGEFLWLRFDQSRLLDLGDRDTETVNLEAGINAFAYSAFPSGYRVSDLVTQLGWENVNAVRLLDAYSGQWRSIVIEDGTLLGADYPVPEVALLLVDLKVPVTEWRPQ